MTHTTWDYAALLHTRGFRVTPQRRLILDAICASGGHATPDEIYARVRAAAPAINRATIYRNLNFLCKLRMVHTTSADGHQQYELADRTPHHHLVCRQCGYVAQIGHETVKNFFAKVEREYAFTVDTDHLALLGLCRKCRGT